jgi:hypothetical protein
MDKTEYEESWRQGEQPPGEDETPLKDAVNAARKRADDEAQEFRDAFAEETKEPDDESK